MVGMTGNEPVIRTMSRLGSMPKYDFQLNVFICFNSILKICMRRQYPYAIPTLTCYQAVHLKVVDLNPTSTPNIIKPIQLLI